MIITYNIVNCQVSEVSYFVLGCFGIIIKDFHNSKIPQSYIREMHQTRVHFTFQRHIIHLKVESCSYLFQ